MRATEDRQPKRESSILEQVTVRRARKPKAPTPGLDAIAYAALAVVADAKKDPAALPPGPHTCALAIFATIDKTNWAANYQGLLTVAADGSVSFVTTEKGK